MGGIRALRRLIRDLGRDIADLRARSERDRAHLRAIAAAAARDRRLVGRVRALIRTGIDVEALAEAIDDEAEEADRERHDYANRCAPAER